MPDYKKKEFSKSNSDYAQVGLKISQIENELLQDFTNNEIDFEKFYEIHLNNNNNNNNNNNTRNICVHFCPCPV